MSDFVASYRYFFTPQGLPFFGRSVCYRLSATAPLLAVAEYSSEALSIGEAKRAFHEGLRYFIGHGALKQGAPTQGVFEDDERLVDNYSGPASSFWSLRALNIALWNGHRTGLWDAEEAMLPIEMGDFSFDISEIKAKVIGISETQEVVVIFQQEYTLEQSPLSRRLVVPSKTDRWLERLIGRAERPKNNLLRKGVTCYSSKMGCFF